MVKILVKYSFFCLLVGIQACNFDNTYYDSPLSPEVVNKLVFINDALEYSIILSQQKNTELYAKLKKDIERANEKDSSDLKRIEELRTKAAHTFEVLRQLKNLISKKTVGLKKDTEDVGIPHHNLTSFDKKTKNYEAEKLRKTLDDYVSYLNQNFKDKFSTPLEKLTKDQEGLSFTKSGVIKSSLSFTDYYFENTSAILTLTVLSQKQVEILRYEEYCLRRKTYMDMGWGFDYIAPIASVESSVVQEGNDYVAQLYIAQRPHMRNVRMIVNGNRIHVDEKEVGQVRLKATGKGKQKWRGSITIQYKGRDTTFHIEKEYEVIPKLNDK